MGGVDGHPRAECAAAGQGAIDRGDTGAAAVIRENGRGGNGGGGGGEAATDGEGSLVDRSGAGVGVGPGKLPATRAAFHEGGCAVSSAGECRAKGVGAGVGASKGQRPGRAVPRHGGGSSERETAGAGGLEGAARCADGEISVAGLGGTRVAKCAAIEDKVRGRIGGSADATAYPAVGEVGDGKCAPVDGGCASVAAGAGEGLDANTGFDEVTGSGNGAAEGGGSGVTAGGQGGTAKGDAAAPGERADGFGEAGEVECA